MRARQPDKEMKVESLWVVVQGKEPYLPCWVHLKLDMGPVQLSDGNSCGAGTPLWRPHVNEANGQLIRELITD